MKKNLLQWLIRKWLKKYMRLYFTDNVHQFLKTSLFITVLLLMGGCAGGENKNAESEPIISKIPENAIPIKYHDGRIYFTCITDGVEGLYLFDTGADGLIFDSTFYSERPFDHKKIVQTMLPGVGTGGFQQTRAVYDTVNIDFSNLNLKTNIVPIVDLKIIAGDKIDGVIGASFFINSVLVINFEKEYIQVLDCISGVDISGFSKIPMKVEQNRTNIPISVEIDDEVRITGDIVLDTGSPGTINLTSDMASRHNLELIVKDKTKLYRKYGGISGESSGYVFYSNSFQISDLGLQDVIIEYSLDKSGSLANRKGDEIGLLGTGILDKYDVIIDFSNSNLYLKQNSNIKPIFEMSKLGFTFVDRRETLGGLIVTGFYAGSNAEASGLKIDDRIITINHKDVAKIDIENYNDFIGDNQAVALGIVRDQAEFDFSFNLEKFTSY